MRYRPDIDGLLAISVLLMVGFHTFPSDYPGGFIGVDAFFVISVYLISGIIFSGLRDVERVLAHLYQDCRAPEALAEQVT
jgi:peptidoglycan/LPS O-acetylase OafA/YrhL